MNISDLPIELLELTVNNMMPHNQFINVYYNSLPYSVYTTYREDTSNKLGNDVNLFVISVMTNVKLIDYYLSNYTYRIILYNNLNYFACKLKNFKCFKYSISHGLYNEFSCVLAMMLGPFKYFKYIYSKLYICYDLYLKNENGICCYADGHHKIKCLIYAYTHGCHCPQNIINKHDLTKYHIIKN